MSALATAHHPMLSTMSLRSVVSMITFQGQDSILTRYIRDLYHLLIDVTYTTPSVNNAPICRCFAADRRNSAERGDKWQLNAVALRSTLEGCHSTMRLATGRAVQTRPCQQQSAPKQAQLRPVAGCARWFSRQRQVRTGSLQCVAMAAAAKMADTASPASAVVASPWDVSGSAGSGPAAQ
jgi:hypothetical protein